jgi:hypothetical protein
MKRRIIQALLLAGAMSGCVNIDGGPETGGPRPNFGRSSGPPMVPGVAGPYGTKVPMAAPYNSAPPGSHHAAMQMMQRSVPMNMVQQHPPGMPMSGPPGAHMPNIPVPPGGLISPPGMPALPGGMAGPNVMQTAGMQGPMQGTGVMNANLPPNGGGVTPAQFAGPAGSMFPAQRTQVFISQPANMKVYWYTQGPDGKPNYSTTPLETPGRYNFAQGAIYRLKLTHIPGRPALELYPTLEVVPTSPKTNEFLAHNSVPLEFTEDDFKQVVDRNYIVKVVYLPDPQFQDGAGAGPDSIVSTRLEPGQDPIQEALRRGSILLVIRMGNIDQGLQHSPAMSAPTPGGAPNMKPPGQGIPPLFQVPFPVPVIPPGGMAPPNAMPALPGAGVVPPKGELIPEKKGEAIQPPNPPLPPLPAAPDLKLEVPAIPKIDIKETPANLTLPSTPIVPTSNSKKETIDVPAPPPLNPPSIPLTFPPGNATTPDAAPITLPPLGPIDMTPASRPELPMIPMIPGKN